MKKFWSKVVQGLTPYVAGEQPKLANLIKLNTNENPYAPSPKVLEVLRAEAADSLRLYPDPNSDALKAAIAESHHLDASQVFVGNGSDEVLAHIFQALLKHDAPLLFPDITYSFYPVYCGLYDIEYQTILLSDAFEIQIDDYFKTNGGIIFANPNAPTGCLLMLTEIKRLLQVNTESVVVIDEAYIDFGGESAVAFINDFPNLLVTRTLSKGRSLAGLRVGYAVGHRDLMEALHRVKDSFNSYPLGRLAQAGGIAALEDHAYFEKTRQKVIDAREFLVAELQGLAFEVLPSTANFIFAKHKVRGGAYLAEKLRSYGIVVRHFKNPPRIAAFLRITIGTKDECRKLIHALKEILEVPNF